jgi:hypothetical protein
MEKMVKRLIGRFAFSIEVIIGFWLSDNFLFLYTSRADLSEV